MSATFDSSLRRRNRALVVLVAAALAVLVAAPQFAHRACRGRDCLSLWHCPAKYRALAPANPVWRDFSITSTDGVLRQMDDSLSPDARAFVIGVLGETNGQRLGLLFAINDHLFPRRVDISLDEPPRFRGSGWFSGRAGASDLELALRGYDLVIDLSQSFQESQNMWLRRLTPRGAVSIQIQ